jgi:hypothetical protein
MLRTFHNYPHIISETVGNTQCLCDSHPSLVLGQLVYLLQGSLNPVLPKHVFEKRLYDTLRHGQCM